MADVKCCTCGEVFGLSDWTETFLRRSSMTFWCPFGHPQHFKLEEPVEEPKSNVVKLGVIDGDKE